MGISNYTIEEINRRADMLALAQEYTKMTHRGSHWWGLSPFKQERTPSFCVTPEKNVYYCFSTQKGGSIFNFIMEIEKLTFPEAAEYLAKKLGIEIQYNSDNQKISHHKDALRNLYNRVTKSFAYLLESTPSGTRACKYLLDRGIRRETIKQRSIGYAPRDPRWLHSFLRAKSYSESFLAHSGLFSSRNREKSLFIDRIMFPICDKQANPVAFGGRILNNGTPKYINTPTTELFHKGAVLYGIETAFREAKQQNAIYVVEGYIDQLALWQSGRTNCVAPLGTALTTEHARLLKRLCDNVIIVFDADQAGTQALLRAAQILLQTQVEVQVCTFPSGYDPADILSQKGEKDLINILDTNNKYLIEFLTGYFLDNKIITHDNHSHLAFRRIFEYISLIGSNIRREQYLYQVADYSGISRDSVIKDYQQYIEEMMTSRRNIDQSRRSSLPEKSLKSNRELFLMLASYANPDDFAYVRSQLDEQHFRDSRALTLFRALDRAFRNNEQSIDNILQYIEDLTLRQYVSRSLVSREFSEGGRELLLDGVRSLQERRFKQRRSQLIRELEHYSKITATQNQNDNATEITRLQHEIDYLNEEIQKRHLSQPSHK